MLTVACVLRSGGEYTADHVARLQDGVSRHLALRHRFVCLSDVSGLPCETIPLKRSWPGWFSKLELFDRETLPGQVLYLDLDTIIVGPLDPIATGHRFTVLRNFWVGPKHPRIGSGLMAWGVDLSHILRQFAHAPEGYMAAATAGAKDNHGDQGIIQQLAPIQPDRWQDVHPGKVVSYKMHCADGVPRGASVVCFHGRPRPWDTPLWGA